MSDQSIIQDKQINRQSIIDNSLISLLLILVIYGTSFCLIFTSRFIVSIRIEIVILKISYSVSHKSLSQNIGNRKTEEWRGVTIEYNRQRDREIERETTCVLSSCVAIGVENKETPRTNAPLLHAKSKTLVLRRFRCVWKFELESERATPHRQRPPHCAYVDGVGLCAASLVRGSHCECECESECECDHAAGWRRPVESALGDDRHAAPDWRGHGVFCRCAR